MLLFLFLLFFFLPFSHQLPVVCYYVLNQPPISKVPVDYCSHIILINSAHISENGELDIDELDLEMFAELSSRKEDLKLLVSITSSNPSWTTMTSDSDLMNNFSKNLTSILKNLNLHGVDIDWEFPEWSRDAKKGDRARFGELLKNLNSHLEPDNLLLSVAVSGPPTISKKAYDVEALTKYADMVQVMNYDFHVFNKFSNPFVGFNAPIHPMRFEISVLGKMNSEASMKTWLDLGLPKNKTFFGIPTYARGYQLLTEYLHKPYSPAIRSRPEITNYDQVCLFSKNPYYTNVWNRHAMAPYLYGPDGLWISYENSRSILAKMAFALEWKAAGVMVYSIGSDDYKGKCGYGKYPLLSEIAKLAEKH